MRRQRSRLGEKNCIQRVQSLFCAPSTSPHGFTVSLCIDNLCVIPLEAVSGMLAEGFLPIRTWQREQMGSSEVCPQLWDPCFSSSTISHPAVAPFQPLQPPWPAVRSLYSLIKASDHVFMLKPLRQTPPLSQFLEVRGAKVGGSRTMGPGWWSEQFAALVVLAAALCCSHWSCPNENEHYVIYNSRLKRCLRGNRDLFSAAAVFP